MKKLITLLLVLTGCVCTANAADDIYFVSNLNSYSTSANKFTFSHHDNGSNEDVYTYEIDATSLSDDIYFRMYISGWGAQITSFKDKGDDSYTFSNGKWETKGSKYEKTYYQGENRAYKINHSVIKASKYLLTIYRGFNNVDYENENCKVMWVKVDIVSMPVSVTSAGYATFSCNRALNLSGLESNGIKAYIASTTSASKVSMEKEDGIIPANTGLFLQSTSGSAVSTTVPVVETSAASSWSKSNALVASNGEEVAAGNYVFAKQGGDYGFYKLGSAQAISAGKAYLSASAISASRLAISFDDETTGIGQIESDVQPAIENAVVYNLNGQRVVNPTKGLYIVNGKKVIIK